MAQYSNRHDGLVIYGLPANPVIGTIAVDIADGKLKKYSGSVWVSQEITSGTQLIASLKEVYAAGTSVPAVVATTWNIKKTNTLVDPFGIILNSAAFTGTGGTNTDIQLGAGTYYVEGNTSYVCIKTSIVSRLRFRNITDATTALTGVSDQMGVGSGNAIVPLYISGLFTIAATKTFQLQQWTESGNAAVTVTGVVETENYSSLKITKVA